MSVAKVKMDQTMTALKKDYESTLEEKDAKIRALEEDVRSLLHSADQSRVLATESYSLCSWC